MFFRFSGGQTVHNDDAVLATKMRRVARRLNLKVRLRVLRRQKSAHLFVL